MQRRVGLLLAICILGLFFLVKDFGIDINNNIECSLKDIRDRSVNKKVQDVITTPITVTGNSELAALAVRGNGSVTQPYIIENITIIWHGGYLPLLLIKETSVYFIIQNCIFDGGEIGGHSGLNLVQVSNGVIWNNTFTGDGTGLYSYECTNLIIDENIFSQNYIGVHIRYGAGLFNIMNNLFYNNTWEGMLFYDSFSTELNIINNTFEHGRGLSTSSTSNVNILNNRFIGVETGISSGGHNYVIKNNSFYNTSVGISTGSDYSSIRYNIFKGVERGFYVGTAEQTDFSHNLIEDSYTGFWMDTCTNAIFNNNSLFRNVYGFYAYEEVSQNSIVNNTITDHQLTAIHFRSLSWKNIVSGNLIINNSRGVHIGADGYFPCSENVIRKNIFVNNREHAIFLDDSTSGQGIHWNDLINNNLGGKSQIYDAGENNNIRYNFYDDWFTNDPITPYSIWGDSGNSDLNPMQIPFYVGPIEFITCPTIVYPIAGQTVVDTIKIEWTKSINYFNVTQNIVYDVFYSNSGGLTWNNIEHNISTTSILWDTRTLMDGNFYVIKVIAKSSNYLFSEDVTDQVFKIQNSEITTSILTTQSLSSSSLSNPSSTPQSTSFMLSPFAFLILLILVSRLVRREGI